VRQYVWRSVKVVLKQATVHISTNFVTSTSFLKIIVRLPGTWRKREVCWACPLTLATLDLASATDSHRLHPSHSVFSLHSLVFASSSHIRTIPPGSAGCSVIKVRNARIWIKVFSPSASDFSGSCCRFCRRGTSFLYLFAVLKSVGIT
jgi:hypothetical protein